MEAPSRFRKNGRYSLILALPLVIGAISLVSGSVILYPIASLINLGATIWFGILPSNSGANRYGDVTNRPPG